MPEYRRKEDTMRKNDEKTDGIIVERLKGLDSLLNKLDCNSEKLSADDQGEISIIREIRRVWDVDQNE